MSIAYVDTHVAAWLYGDPRRLSEEARRQIDHNDLLLSPMAFLELQYLFDRKRIGARPIQIFLELHSQVGLTLCNFPFPAIATEALNCIWTTDPFDRIIVSHAKANGDSVLITSDLEIRKNYPGAKW